MLYFLLSGQGKFNFNPSIKVGDIFLPDLFTLLKIVYEREEKPVLPADEMAI